MTPLEENGLSSSDKEAASGSLEDWIAWIEANDLEEPEFLATCKKQFEKEGPSTDIVKLFGIMSAYDHGTIPIIDGLIAYELYNEGLIQAVLHAAPLIGLKKALAYCLTVGLLKTVCSDVDVTPKQALRVMVPWGGTSLLTQFAVEKAPELNKTKKDFWAHRKEFRKMMAEELPEKTLLKEVEWWIQFDKNEFLKEILSDQGILSVPSFESVDFEGAEADKWKWEEEN